VLARPKLFPETGDKQRLEGRILLNCVMLRLFQQSARQINGGFNKRDWRVSSPHTVGGDIGDDLGSAG